MKSNELTLTDFIGKSVQLTNLERDPIPFDDVQTESTMGFSRYIKSTGSEYTSRTSRSAMHESASLSILDGREIELMMAEQKLMQDKSSKILKHSSAGLTLAKRIAESHFSIIDDKHIQSVIFNIVHEAALMVKHDGSEDAVMLLDGIIETLGNKTGYMMVDTFKEASTVKQSTADQSRRALQLIRKARATGDVYQVIDAIAAVLTTFLGGTGSDLGKRPLGDDYER